MTEIMNNCSCNNYNDNFTDNNNYQYQQQQNNNNNDIIIIDNIPSSKINAKTCYF